MGGYRLLITLLYKGHGNRKHIQIIIHVSFRRIGMDISSKYPFLVCSNIFSEEE